MSKDSYRTIRTLIASQKIEEIRKGLELVRNEISRIGSDESKPLFEIVSTVFYIDPWDKPDFMPILDEAISLVVGFGKWIIPELLKHLDAGDIKAQLAISQVLGRIGKDAIKPLMDEYESSSDPMFRSFIIYTLGKIKSPNISEVGSLVIEAAHADNLELRDTATRSIGKIVESIPPSHLSDELHREFIATLRNNLADTNAGVRAKAVRSFGKLAKYGHLNGEEREKLKVLCNRILGTDDEFEWDRAYVVRREAEEALEHL